MMTNKIAIVLDEELEVWQKLNVCAFLSSGIAAHDTEGLIGSNYQDGSARQYLPIFNQPVIIYACNSSKLQTVLNRTQSRDITTSIYIRDMFVTNNDIDNRQTVQNYVSSDLPVVGLGLFGPSKDMDKVLSGVRRHP